jgi:hypothetical protein
LRNSQILGHHGHHTRALFTDHATVTDRDIKQSVVFVAGLCGRVETDLLESMYGIGESEPEHFPARSLGCARDWISCLPLGHDSLRRHLLRIGQVGYLGLRNLRIERRASLGVGGVELTGFTELRVESYEGRTRLRDSCYSGSSGRTPHRRRGRFVAYHLMRYILPLRSGTNRRPEPSRVSPR